MRSSTLRWMVALSKIKSHRGPGNSEHIGRSLSDTNLLNVSCVYESWSISHAIYPSIVYAGKIDYRSDRLIGRYSAAVTLIDAHPYFRSRFLSFAADSSRKTNWCGSHFASLEYQKSLRACFRSFAWHWISFFENFCCSNYRRTDLSLTIQSNSSYKNQTISSTYMLGFACRDSFSPSPIAVVIFLGCPCTTSFGLLATFHSFKFLWTFNTSE